MTKDRFAGTGLIHAPSTRERLDTAFAAAPPHLQPIARAIRDHGVDAVFVTQESGAFRLPFGASRPVIYLIGDDTDRAIGPSGFHLPSIRRAIRKCQFFSVVASAPEPDAYTAMALAASATRRNTMIVETRIEQEIPWLGLIQKLAPKRFVFLSTVKGGRA